MNRRTFLALLATGVAGCARQTPEVAGSRTQTTTASPSPATAAAHPPELLGTVLVARHLDFEDPAEFSVRTLFTDGTCKQICTWPQKNRSVIPRAGGGNQVGFLSDEKIQLGVIGPDGLFKMSAQRTCPKSAAPLGFFANQNLVVAKTFDDSTRKWQLLTWDSKGQLKANDFGFQDEIRHSGLSANYLATADLGGSYSTSPAQLSLFKADSSGLKKLLTYDLTPITGNGYAGDITFWEDGENLLISTGVMDSEKYGDALLLFKKTGDTLELVQRLPGDLFRPPPLTFVSATMGFVQDNAGNLHTYARGGKEWQLVEKVALEANGAYTLANSAGTVLFTKNNPGDILAFKLTTDGKLSPPIAFPDLKWEVSGRNPARIQHDIVAVLD